MSRIKTLGLTAWLVIASIPAQAADTFLNDLSTCTGQVSAAVEHSWLVQPSASDQLEAMRDHLEEILEAVALPSEAAAVLNTRVGAKMAFKALLFSGDFGQDPVWRAQASAMAQRKIRLCQSLALLG